LKAVTREPYAYTYDNPVNLTDPSGLDVFGDFQNAVIGGAKCMPVGVQHAVRIGAQAAAMETHLLHDYLAVPVAKASPGIQFACGYVASTTRHPLAIECAIGAGLIHAAYEVANGKTVRGPVDAVRALAPALEPSWLRSAAGACNAIISGLEYQQDHPVDPGTNRTTPIKNPGYPGGW
jgi:hypothetical protein